MTLCWDSNPALRPTFVELASHIASELGEMAEYFALSPKPTEDQDQESLYY